MHSEGAEEKQTTRDSFMDNVKGILIISVVFVHIYDMTCAASDWTHLLRLAILTVQMPLFMFVSGYFGKNITKRREEAIRLYLIPFFVFNTLYFLVRHWQGEEFTYGALRPFNMYWYLLTLILYRLLMDNLKHVRGLFPLSIVMALLAGLDQHLGRTLSLSRAIGFFPFYLMGLYCPKEWIERAKKIPRLAAVLLLILGTLAAEAIGLLLDPLTEASHPYQLVSSYAAQGLTWGNGMLMRLSIYVLAPVMGAAVLALCPRVRCLFTKIGRNSLEVYLLHAFPMLLVLQYLPHRLPATVGTIVLLLVYSLVISLLLASDVVARAYHTVFDTIERWIFSKREQPMFPFSLLNTETRQKKTQRIRKTNRQTM